VTIRDRLDVINNGRIANNVAKVVLVNVDLSNFIKLFTKHLIKVLANVVTIRTEDFLSNVSNNLKYLDRLVKHLDRLLKGLLKVFRFLNNARSAANVNP